MPDQFTQTITTSYGSRIVNSFKGIVFGIILLVASFGILYWNEGRVDLSAIAKNAISVDSAVVNSDQTLQGKLVSTTGNLITDETLGDNLYLNPGKYIALKRNVEMYAWVEKESNSSHTNVGGSETTTANYTYVKEWTDSPKSESSFKSPEGHQNPEMTLSDSSPTVTNAKLGIYSVDPKSLSLHGFEEVSLNKDNTILDKNTTLEDNHVYIKFSKDSSYANPIVGDMRISYQAVNSGITGTVFGNLSGDSIVPHIGDKNTTLYEFTTGSKEEGIATMHSEYETMLWILRALGFVLMFIGFTMLFGPISILLDFFPVFGSISRGLIGLLSFVISLVLSIVTILVSMILHSFVAVITALIIVVGLIVFVFFRIKKGKQSNQNTSSISTSPSTPVPPVTPPPAGPTLQ